MKRKQAEAAAALAAAAVSRSGEGVIPETTAREARAAANVVANAVTPRIIKRSERLFSFILDEDSSRREIKSIIHFEIIDSNEKHYEKDV